MCLLDMQRDHRPPALPSASVLTTPGRGGWPGSVGTGSGSQQGRAGFVGSWLPLTVTRGNLDASCEIPEVALNSETVLGMQLPHSLRKRVTGQSLPFKSVWVPNFCQANFKKKLCVTAGGYSETLAFTVGHVHTSVFAFADINLFEFCYHKCQKSNYDNVYTHDSPRHKPEIMPPPLSATESPRKKHPVWKTSPEIWNISSS